MYRIVPFLKMDPFTSIAPHVLASTITLLLCLNCQQESVFPFLSGNYNEFERAVAIAYEGVLVYETKRGGGNWVWMNKGSILRFCNTRH